MGGDGTVPRVSGTPIELDEAKREVYAAETHGAIQNADGTLANLKGVLTRDKIDFRKFQRAEDAAMLRLELDDVVLPGEKLRCGCGPPTATPRCWSRSRRPQAARPSTRRCAAMPSRAGSRAEFELPPGIWRVTAHGDGASPVSDLVVVAQA